MSDGVPGLTYLLELAGRRLADLEAVVVQKDAEVQEWMKRAMSAGWKPDQATTNGQVKEESVR